MRQNLSTRRLRCVTAATVAVIMLVALGGCTRTGGSQSVLQAFLSGWPAGTLDKVGFLDANGAPIAAADVAGQIKALAGDLATRPIALAPAGRPSEHGDDATATVNVAWTVTDRVTWRYRTTVRMHRKDGTWRVVWTPSTVQADLKAGDALALRVLPATRAGILDGAGEAIVKARPVVVVGV